jgi:hypothetical protein
MFRRIRRLKMIIEIRTPKEFTPITKRIPDI